MIQPPLVDDRTGEDFVQQMHEDVALYAPGANVGTESRELVDGLVGVFGRFCEIIADRINRAPEKHFLAFLQMLGLSNRPPQAAQVPLTFYLSSGSTGPTTVPARTQVAAQPLKSESEPMVFETDCSLVVVPHKLDAMFAFDGRNDNFADLSQLLPQAPPAKIVGQAGNTAFLLPAYSAFTGVCSVPHRLYLAFDIASPPNTQLDGLRVRFETERSAEAPHSGKKPSKSVVPEIEWRLLVPHAEFSTVLKNDVEPAAYLPSLVGSALAISPTEDTTNGLTTPGEIFFTNIPASPLLSSGGNLQYWIECRLLTPVVPIGNTEPGRLIGTDIATIKSVGVSWEVSRNSLPLEQAFANATGLDITKDFYPFGEMPKFGDTLYLASSELFSRPNVDVTLSFEITNPSGAENLPIAATAPDNVRLAWEFFDGSGWSSFGYGGRGDGIQLVAPDGEPLASDGFLDTANCFSADGEVKLRISRPPVQTIVNGKRNYWIRASIVGGSYGSPAHYDGKIYVPATYAPPVIHRVLASYYLAQDTKPTASVTYNSFAYTVVNKGEAFQPFTPAEAGEAYPSLYLGFSEPAPSMPARLRVAEPPHFFPSEPMSLFLQAQQSAQGIASRSTSDSAAVVHWQFWDGARWAQCNVLDDTGGLRQPGLIRFIAPVDFKAVARFGLTRYWLRAVPVDPAYQSKISAALLNTVMATGCTSVLNEVLGVSNGTPQQSYSLLHKPVLTGQQLDILEPQLPSKAELEAIRKAEGENAIEVISQAAGREVVRVRWHQVESFQGSFARDRHYVLDPLSGTVLFGDGVQGQIPPRGAKILMSLYRTGGGSSGNRPPLNITQIKTAVPFIDKVCNWVAAAGGGDVEDTPTLIARGSHSLRHRGRAVTAEDFEDLACLASPQVARAKCVPARDLLDPTHPAARKSGSISLILVPRSTEPSPQPASQLLDCVLRSLEQASLPTVQVIVTGPTYIRVDVTAQVVVENFDLASQVVIDAQQALESFLHPLTGGPRGAGWDFGSRPHRSQLYTLLETIPGVSYVRDVRSEFVVPQIVRGRDLNLVSAGTVKVEVSLDS